MQYATGWIMNLTIIAIVTGTGAIPLNAQEATESSQSAAGAMEKQVTQVLEKQAAAWNEGDLDTYMETYWKSPDLTFSSGGRTTRGWQATLDRYKKSYDTRAKMGHLRFDHLEFQQLADNVALMLGTWHLTRESDAPHGNFSLVLKQVDGKWKIVHDHSSTLEESSGDDRP